MVMREALHNLFFFTLINAVPFALWQRMNLECIALAGRELCSELLPSFELYGFSHCCIGWSTAAFHHLRELLVIL